jgi:hypothetical protein
MLEYKSNRVVQLFILVQYIEYIVFSLSFWQPGAEYVKLEKNQNFNLGCTTHDYIAPSLQHAFY